jgi:primosomal protein N' (replication factor Y)
VRPGVGRLRAEVEALIDEPVTEVVAGDATTAATGAAGPTSRVVVGTEAVLHHVRRADVVAFVDFDEELLAARYRAGEQAFVLLVRAARLLGPRARGGRLLVQTTLPGHEVVEAALHADPERLTELERAKRQALRYPPTTALAEVSGPSADVFVAALATAEVEVLGPSAGRWLIRAADHGALADALASVPRPPGRLRVEVDPLRV